ncbi:MAG: serine hydrolase, partial [Armatimonadota bacterium]
MNEGHSRSGKRGTPKGGDGKPRYPVHPDTIFDLASVTKMVATNTAIQILRDEDALSLDHPLACFFPEVRSTDKGPITVLHLLTHTSGLPGWRAWFRELSGKDAYLEAIAALPLQAEIGARYEYSDLGFMLLGVLVERVAGVGLDEFARRRIFQPLGMEDTCFAPAPEAWGRCAATEDCSWRERIIQGEVHDENAFAVGGVAGHAGLFSTAPDLACFAQLLLDSGEHAGTRILQEGTVRALNVPPLPEVAPTSGLGWRLDTERKRWRWLASAGAFGHSGFTGTSLWIDPEQQAASILLTNAIHPRRERSRADALRREFHTVLRDHLLGHRPAAGGPRVKCGLDMELREDCPRLRGKRVGLACNQTAVAGNGRHALDALRSCGARVVRLFAAEHGLRGDAPAGESIASGVEPRSGLPFVSLYGRKRRPSPADLAGLDVLVYDMQQVGVRFYTHVWSLRECMQAAAECGLPFVVLDRPGVVGPLREGNILEEGFASFVGQKPLAWRHALTNGELAQLYLARGWLGAGAALELTVVLVEGYERAM